MKKIIIASTRKSSGKTGTIVGLAKALNKRCGYIKPLGDRLLYRKKRLWDFDAALVASVLELKESAEEITIGFERAKLRYMYNEEQLRAKLRELAEHTGANQDVLFVEAGTDLSHGVSVHLDALSMARTLGGRLVLVVSGAEDSVVDDIAFVKRNVDLSGIDCGGVIINKVPDIEEFKYSHLEDVKKLDVNVLGLLPYRKELTHVTVQFLSEILFARVIAGEHGLNRIVKNIFVGAMSADSALRNPLFTREDKLIITSGDRSDMILSSLDHNTAGVVLTHNILPPQNIIAKAEDKGIPMLLVPTDTFQVAKQIDDMEPLLTRNDADKIALLEQMAKENIDLGKLLA